MGNVPGWWRWVLAVAVAGALLVVALPRLQTVRSAGQAVRGEAVPGQLVIEEASNVPFSFSDERFNAYVDSVRAASSAYTDEEARLDREDLIRMGRRICYHLTRSAITSTRDYVRVYRTQRRQSGYRVYNQLLVQGAAVAETAPSTFCPEHVGAVSAREAAQLVGVNADADGQSAP